MHRARGHYCYRVLIIAFVALPPLKSNWVTSLLPTALVAKEHKESSEEYRLGPRAKIELTLQQGSIKLETWNKPFAVVTVTKYACTLEELEQTTLQVNPSELSLIMNAQQPHAQSIINVSLIVPAGARVTLTVQGKGDIDVATAPRALTVHTQYGNVKITTRTDGTITANTEQGSTTITCEVFSPSSSLLATAPNGSIKVTLPPFAQAFIDAQTEKGVVTSDFPITFAPFTTKLGLNTWKKLRKKVKGSIGDSDKTPPITLSARSDIKIEKLVQQ